MKNLLKESILATLKYHDIFDYPLTLDEISQFLIIKHQTSYCHSEERSDVGISRDCHALWARNDILKLIKEKKIVQKDNLYCLRGREKIIDLRKQREKYSWEKIVVVNKIIQLIKLIPWVKMVGVTGALAMNNSTEDDDIDLLIVTTKNRMWLARLISVLILELLGYRRRPQTKNYKNKICLNMFLDETVLRQAQDRQNLYTAHEVAQMKPIFNKEQTYEKFLKANEWVKKYLPNSFQCQNSRLCQGFGGQANLKTKKSYFLSLSLYIFDYLEQLVYQLQLQYMKSKMTREQVNKHFAFFHPKDRTKAILNEYNKISFNK